MSGKLTRQRWEEVRDNYAGSVEDADALAQEAIRELDDVEAGGEITGPPATAWALLSIARRIEALSDMFLDFMEPAGGRARGEGGEDD